MVRILLALLLMVGLATGGPMLPGCGDRSTTTPTTTESSGTTEAPVSAPPAATEPETPSTGGEEKPAAKVDPIFVGAGDIAECGTNNDEATALLLDGIVTGNPKAEVHVFTAGDNAYEDGTTREFTDCYEPTWGRHKTRTRAAPGNHDYGSGNAAGYFAYFGTDAGDPTKGYYSYTVGTWLIVVLNSNCSQVGGCETGSAQGEWLERTLAAASATCTLAIWHHPRFSSGIQHPSDSRTAAFWELLYQHKAEIVLNGHDHNYQRFAPQTPEALADATRGIREFIVGTGGAAGAAYTFGPDIANGEVRQSGVFGVLQLTLHTDSYDWQFVPIAGQTFTDSGTGTCH